jgi:hypothetical protein
MGASQGSVKQCKKDSSLAEIRVSELEVKVWKLIELEQTYKKRIREKDARIRELEQLFCARHPLLGRVPDAR